MVLLLQRTSWVAWGGQVHGGHVWRMFDIWGRNVNDLPTHTLLSEAQFLQLKSRDNISTNLTGLCEDYRS